MATPQETETSYQCEFVDNVKDYECPLCLHVTREPNLTTCCGQHFCQHCIQTVTSNKKPCPFCKEASFITFLDKKQKRRVLELKVYCTHKDSCDWVGGLGELEQHLAEKCKYVTIECPNNCEDTMPRWWLYRHKISECPKRPHHCKYCQLVGTYQDIEENHIPVCPKYPVSCPNKCKASCLKREGLKEHLRECPLAMVECELREVGCEEMVQRKDLDRHMEQAARRHLTLSTNYFVKEIAELRQENQKLRHNCQQQIAECETKLTALTNQVKLLSDKPIVVNLTVNYTQLKTGMGWENPEIFQTCSGYTMKINLKISLFEGFIVLPVIRFELTHVKSKADDNLKWPATFSMKVKLLNQTGDHHHEVSGDNLQVKRGGMNDEVRIYRRVIENHARGVQYIANGYIKLKITVAEK